MIAYVKGILAEVEGESIIVESYGVGYRIFIPATVLEALPVVGEEVKIYTYQSVKEDALDLYGFMTRDDQSVFEMLLSVSGIGPKGALAILSCMTANDLRIAVISSDAKAIAKANGIGSKTAQRVVIDLKDKFSMEDVLYGESLPRNEHNAKNRTARDEAIEALTSLGYSASEATSAIARVEIAEDADSEAILKAALKNLAFI